MENAVKNVHGLDRLLSDFWVASPQTPEKF